jgi:hypothetical protein
VPLWSRHSPVVIFLACILIIACVSALTRMVILPLLGIQWPFSRVKVPWRFSLSSVTVLVGLCAGVLGFLRDSPEAAFVAMALVTMVWFTVVRFLGFRRDLAQRRRQEFASAIEAKEVAEASAVVSRQSAVGEEKGSGE